MTDSSVPGGQVTPTPARRDRQLVASGLLGILWISLPPLAGFYILYDLQDIAAYLQKDLQHGFWAYVAVFAISAGLGLLPTYSQAFLGGWVFGMKWGLVGSIMGFTGGAAIGYLFARAVTGDSVDRWIDRHPKGRVIRDALARGSIGRTFFVVTLLRLPPSSPFAMTNYALGATRVPFWLAMVATPIGMLPRTAVVCFLAAGAAATGAESIMQVFKSQPLWVTIAGIASAVLVVVVIGQIAQRALAKYAPPTAVLEDGR
ncbi:MAG: TVP38/TMEM64 family protein [bacterium]